MIDENGKEVITIDDITKDDIQSYEDTRQSGETNMFDVRMVMELSGLDRKKIMVIMQHYDELITKYEIDRG